MLFSLLTPAVPPRGSTYDDLGEGEGSANASILPLASSRSLRAVSIQLGGTEQ